MLKNIFRRKALPDEGSQGGEERSDLLLHSEHKTAGLPIWTRTARPKAEEQDVPSQSAKPPRRIKTGSKSCFSEHCGRHKENHVILFGFKHVGKSSVGKALAVKLHRQFIDLDAQIEQDYQQNSPQSLSCREIFHQHGEKFFRDSESRVLQKVLRTSAAVIAVGGGTPLKEENRVLLQPHWLVQITAAPEIVYQRLIIHGIPAFFTNKTDPAESFRSLWEARQPLYAGLADCTVDNSQTIDETVVQILKYWHHLSHLSPCGRGRGVSRG